LRGWEVVKELIADKEIVYRKSGRNCWEAGKNRRWGYWQWLPVEQEGSAKIIGLHTCRGAGTRLWESRLFGSVRRLVQ